ncbi:MAG: sulfatase [Myxococcales bacterium]|nr:sulfatase [Myxococcales bacterium]
MPAPSSTWASRSLLTGLAGAAILVPVEALALQPLSGDLLWVSASLLLGLGLAIALLLLAAEWVVAALRRRGGDRRGLATAGIRAAASLLALVPVAANLFEGAFAATLPGASIAPYVLPTAGFLALAIALAFAGRWLELAPHGQSEHPPTLIATVAKRRRIAGVALLGLTGAVELANRGLFRSEYPDIHTFLIVVACVCAGLGLRLLVAPPELPARAPGRGSYALLALSALLAVNLGLCLQRGLQSAESRLAIATRGNHARMLVRVARGLGDGDGDGFAALLGGPDCDDDDPAIHPDARELVGNDVDENCDGYVAREDLAAAASQAEEAREEQVGAWIEGDEVQAIRARLGDAPILLLTVDALRGDVLEDTPQNRGDFPHLFELLDGSTTFTRAFSPAAGTDLSVSSLITGRVDPFQVVDLTLPEALAARGYRGYAVLPSEVLRYVGKTLITRGFADVHRLINDLHERDVGSYTTSHRTTELGLKYLDAHFGGEHKEAPFLLWLHYFDVHEHHEVKESDRHLQALVGDAGLEPGKAPKYRAMVGLVDRAIGEVITALKERGLWGKTIVVFASDHGESLGEDPRLPDNHGRVLYNALVHIPLAIRLPGVEPRRSDAPVTLVDVLPTLLSLRAGPAAATPSQLDGDTLLPHLLPGAPEALRAATRPLILNESDQHGVILWPYKLLVRGEENITELFDLSRDFGERDNLAAEHPEKVGELRQLYQAAPAVNLDRTTKGRRLRERAAKRPAPAE